MLQENRFLLNLCQKKKKDFHENIRIFTKSFQILEGLPREKKINVSICLQKAHFTKLL